MTASLYSLLFPSLSFSRASVHHFLPQGVWDTRWTPDFYCCGACCSMPPSLCLSVTILRSCCRDHMKPGLPNFCLIDVLNLDLQLYLNPCPVAGGVWPMSPASHQLLVIYFLDYFGWVFLEALCADVYFGRFGSGRGQTTRPYSHHDLPCYSLCASVNLELTHLLCARLC